jgi:hypothetical protein
MFFDKWRTVSDFSDKDSIRIDVFHQPSIKYLSKELESAQITADKLKNAAVRLSKTDSLDQLTTKFPAPKHGIQLIRMLLLVACLKKNGIDASISND